uniref:Uncharacterized protein n=1 Tax=Anguilla anguilla TaxID=7936 RepID=A0A0E9TYH8_ANGAN
MCAALFLDHVQGTANLFQSKCDKTRQGFCATRGSILRQTLAQREADWRVLLLPSSGENKNFGSWSCYTPAVLLVHAPDNLMVSNNQ